MTRRVDLNDRAKDACSGYEATFGVKCAAIGIADLEESLDAAIGVDVDRPLVTWRGPYCCATTVPSASSIALQTPATSNATKTPPTIGS